MHLCTPMLGQQEYQQHHSHQEPNDNGLETATVSPAAPADDLGNLHHHPTPAAQTRS